MAGLHVGLYFNLTKFLEIKLANLRNIPGHKGSSFVSRVLINKHLKEYF